MFVFGKDNPALCFLLDFLPPKLKFKIYYFSYL